jgi:biopolymer transport protein TolR
MGAKVGGGGGGGGPKGGALAGSALSALMSRRGGSDDTTLSEINVTPFVDVVLVLLIIFMITAPMLMRSMDVNLPDAAMRQDEAEERVIVTLDAEGRTFLDEQAVNLVLLEEQLRQRVEVQGLRRAYLRADETLQYGTIIRVIDLMKRAGVDLVGLSYEYPEESR